MEKIRLTGRGDFTIREYLPEKDMDGVLALWKSAFHKEMPISTWKWKYHDNPYGCRMILCLNDQNQPVVLYGGIPYAANWNGNSVEIIQLMDIMSHPDYRKTGLFIQTGNAFFDRFGGPDKAVMLYGFPGQIHFDIGHKYMRYDRIVPGVSYLKASIPDESDPVSKIEGQFTELTGKNAADRVWESVLSDYPLSVQRNSRFVEWRYRHHPVFSYEICGYQSGPGNETSAYLVFRVNRKNAVVVDWLLPNDAVSAKHFLNALFAFLRNKGCTSVETWLPTGHFLCQYALSSGFEALPEPTGIIPTARIFHPSLYSDWMGENLYFTMADGDLM